MAKRDKPAPQKRSIAAAKKPPTEPPEPDDGRGCRGPDKFDLTFNLKFRRHTEFLGHEGQEHIMNFICWFSDYDPPKSFVIEPINTKATKSEIDTAVERHRRYRTLLSLAVAAVDADYEYTITQLNLKLA